MDEREDIRNIVAGQMQPPSDAKITHCKRMASDAAKMGDDPIATYEACMADPSAVSIGAAP
jgi:hypothetical protein